MGILKRHEAMIEKFELKKIDHDGLNFTLQTIDLLQACENCDEALSDQVLKQFSILKILEEQGMAKRFSNGFSIDADSAVCLDDATREVLELPGTWNGSFDACIHGITASPSFKVDLKLVRPNGTAVSYYNQDKYPFISISNQEKYLPSAAQWAALKAIEDHKLSLHDEYHNLLVIYQLQKAVEAECKIQMRQFEQFNLINPEAVSVTAEMTSTGDLNLIPQFGAPLNFSDVEQRLGQLDKRGTVQSLKVGNTFILLSEDKLKAVHEVVQNRTIHKNQVKQFLKSPGAFLDANLVDLELGFSLRVHGATVFKHAYFGETDQSGISWFAEIAKKEDVLPPSKIKELVQSEEELERIIPEIRDAIKKGATVFRVSDHDVDISNSTAVEKALTETSNKIKQDREAAKSSENNEPPVVDIDLNNTEATFGGDSFQAKLDDIIFKGAMDFSYLARQPFPHQEIGIRWFLGLAEEGGYTNPKDATCGGILADDMGLGKTYTALVGTSEYLRICKKRGITERPVLVVAPKSLLDVWEDEVAKTFIESPFKDIVKLHGSGLNKYKKAKDNQVSNKEDDSMPSSLLSLKAGSEFTVERLDMPARLVLTTYETLRNHQFSLCSIDWGIVIFDEAQQIKNPNAITTRAAKGLKACFKLIATGTPVENSLADFWCLMDTAHPKALGSYQNFRTEFIQPILRASEKEKSEVREAIGKKLRQTVGSLMLRRLKEEQLEGLPKKHIYTGIDEQNSSVQYREYLQRVMNGKQLQRYGAIVDAVSELQRSGQKGIVLGGLSQLKSVSLHPRLYKDGDALEDPCTHTEASNSLNESGKLAMVLDILNQAKKKKEKVIIFLISKQLQSHLRIALTKIYGVPINVINGDTKVAGRNAEKTRKGLIESFKQREGFGIIIMSPIAAGTGLTITEANRVIHLERHWNPAKEAQATDRVYRIGQKKDVYVYLPILKHPSMDSFDVNLHRLLSVKTDLKDAVVTPEEVNPDTLFGSTIGREYNGRTEQLRGEDLDGLNWREFEALCTVLYQKEFKGAGVLTPKSGDFGADAYIIGSTQNILIECKHKQDGSKYNIIDPIMKFSFAKKHYEGLTGKKFDQLFLVSNASGYSIKVWLLAKKHDVILVDRREIDKLLKKYTVTQMDIERKIQDN